MNTPRSAACNARKAKSRIDLNSLFWAMAYDLKLQNNKDVINAYALLSAKKYLSFVQRLDEWTSQMYESIGDERYRLHQLAALFSKFPFADEAINRDAVAIAKFSASEHKCRRMNQKFRLRRSRMEPPHMQYMRAYIESVIGSNPPLQQIYDRCDFGPGSSVGVHGSDVSILNKLDMLTVTPSCEPVALTALKQNVHYTEYLTRGDAHLAAAYGPFRDYAAHPVYTQYNKIVCVPKNAKTNRTIAIEPTLNGFIQKGIDLTLRQKLFRIGINLSAQSLNQALARLGSCDRGYATIDLSAASDSISIELVKELLPPEWFLLLNSTRSPSYMLPDGSIRRYEKFCSMGNGFCFPLETLVFRAACEYAMSRTVVHPNKTVSVYGDDIIVPQECALLLIEVLHDLGFAVNRSKTFIFGGFRESCGADFFYGVNVRPIFIKDHLQLGPQCYYLLNDLRKRKLMHTWQKLYESIPVRWRYLRPYERDDDSAITVPMDVFMTSKYARYNSETFSWTWKRVVSLPSVGREPIHDIERLVGKLRGDLICCDAFTARFSERTRVQNAS